ncbi:hypothetical protein TrVGV298_010318 [Trichoderma virens]|nr:hypothetical protein TrVGV298_010318 [Trichoderma virens]
MRVYNTTACDVTIAIAPDVPQYKDMRCSLSSTGQKGGKIRLEFLSCAFQQLNLAVFIDQFCIHGAKPMLAKLTAAHTPASISMNQMPHPSDHIHFNGTATFV